MTELNGVRLLTLKQMCTYLNIGQTKARELLKADDCSFRVRIGNRLYADRYNLDAWLDSLRA